jgi:hypothetical protein
MSPIYKCSILRRVTEAWYSLSDNEQKQLLEQVDQVLKDAGGERVVLYDLRWSADGAAFFGVEKFPNMEAVQEHAQLLDKINWFRYVEAESFLGTEWTEV